ncbi:RHS repeat-associated core domain-containing protein [Streptomyces sp. NPDC058001]|uniref:RHS repeat-associated core domain-containing protein n=1 Tax=Streptomyces sp. NPDC058001 TaxID=3346300 RepID=UPI0036E2318B
MAAYRPTDWHVLDLDKDPTPGDPDRVRTLAKGLHDFADDVTEALRLIKGMAEEDTVLVWAGKSAKAFQDEFSGVPKNLRKLKKSYEMAGDALAAYWPKLERAQALADKALVKGREAQADLSSAQSKLTSAESWVDRAGKEADKYKDDPTGGKDVPKPDPDKVKAATRDAQSAKDARSSAQSDVTSAGNALDAAKKMAEDARKMREDAAREAKDKLDEASDAGIHNRKWWEEVGDWFTDNWDTIVAVCKVVVAVLGIIALIIGGPILGAIVLIAALIVLADTLNKYFKGQASLWDVGFAALDCIPGMKGLTSLGGLAKGLKAMNGLKGGLKGMGLAVRGLGKNGARHVKDLFKGLRSGAADGAKAGKPMKGRCKGGDPVDMITSEMLMSHTDIRLPGLLPLVIERHHVSSFRSGHWFGPAWMSTFDERLELDADGAVCASADGMLQVYPVPEAGAQVLPSHGPRRPLAWDGTPGGIITVSDPFTELTRHYGPALAPDSPDDGGATAVILPLCAVTDRNGHRLDFQRTPEGTPVAVRHSGGYHLTVDTENGRITGLRLLEAADSATGPQPGRVLRTYSYAGPRRHLTAIADSAGRPYRLTYDERGRITSWTDRNDRWYRYEYDGATDRVVRGTGQDGAMSGQFAYDDVRRVTTMTDGLGHRTEYHYDERLHLSRVVDPLGFAVHSEHDPYGRLLSRTDELGNTTRFTLDEHGQPVRVDRPDGTSIHVAYDDNLLPVTVTEADGARWTCAYDDRGNLLTSTDPLGAVSSYTYDERGHRNSQTDALGNTLRFDSDEAGLPVRVIDPRGSVVTVRRDAWGRVVRIDDAVGGTVRQAWSPEGLLLWRQRADGGRESWSYDAEGNLTEHHDTGGFTTAFEYGAFGLPSARTDPDGTRYRFAHDTELQLTAVINPRGDEWVYRYDAAGRLTAETDFNGRSLTYVFDPTGRQVARTNGSGETVRLTRDAAGRVVTSRTDDGTVTSLRYDAAGRLVEAVNPDSRVAYAYDAVGRIVAETVDGRTVAGVYDPLGRRVRRTTPSGATSRWSYDSAGLPTSLVTQAGELTFTHDEAGRETARGLGDAATLTQSWDAGHRLVEQIIRSAAVDDGGPRGATVRQSRSYAYRSDGHLTGITDRLGGTRRFNLDRAGRVTGVSAETWTESYAYDDLGNLTAAAHPAPGGQDAQGPAQRSGTKATSAGRTTYEHDAQGRVVRVIRRTLSGLRRIWTYTWNADDRLTETATPDSGVWRYRYDVLGRRTAKSRLDGDGSVVDEILFTWDCANLAEQQMLRDGQVQTDTWDWEPGTHRAAAQLRSRWRTDSPDEISRQFYAIVTDLVGTPSELVGEDGTIAWRAATSLWGRPLEDEGGDLCPLSFPGQYRDPETGLHYNLARYYDPDTASFLSPDPLGLAPAPNHHAYVDNPFRWSDPLGLEGDSTGPVRVYDDSEYSKHGSGSGSSAKGEVSRAPSNGQAALDRSIDLDPNNPNVTRRLGVDHVNNEIVVLDRHRAITDAEGNVVKEIYHGHVQSSYPSKSVTQGDLTKLKKQGMIDNIKKQRVLPPCDG